MKIKPNAKILCIDCDGRDNCLKMRISHEPITKCKDYAVDYDYYQKLNQLKKREIKY